MFYKLQQAYLLIRYARNLTDILAWGQYNGAACRVFKLFGTHEGVQEMCPGWCWCEISYEIPEDEEVA